VTEEEIYGRYLVVQSYTKVAEEFGMKLSTVWGIVQRIGRDDLEEDRKATRADIALEVWNKIRELIPVVRPSTLGTEKSSQGFEAARAADSLARIAAALEPKDRDQGGAPPVINVYTGLKPASDEPAKTEGGEGGSSQSGG
jgi:hypothetical protein